MIQDHSEDHSDHSNSWCIKAIDKLTLVPDSSASLMYHDLSDLYPDSDQPKGTQTFIDINMHCRPIFHLPAINERFRGLVT